MIPLEVIQAHPDNFRKKRVYFGIPTKVKHIVIHRTGGNFDSAIREFQNGKTQKSSTLVLSETRAVLMVPYSDTPFTNSNWLWNCESITIEHEGYPGKPPTDALYANSSDYVAWIAKEFKLDIFGKEVVVGHRDVPGAATLCPVDIDVNRIKREAAAKIVAMETGQQSQVPQVVVTPPPAPAPSAPTNKVAVSKCSPGETSKVVANLQDRLKQTGDFPLDIESSGYYGDITARAVLNAQKRAGIMPAQATWSPMRLVNSKLVITNSQSGAGYCGPLTAAFLNK